MGFITGIRRLIRGSEPAVVDYESYEQSGTGTDGPVLRRVGPASIPEAPGTYKIQQSYDSLVQTVRDLREALDGQSRRQEELLSRLSTLPHAVEALPQTSKMQSDMLKMINDRLAMHADQQRKITEVIDKLESGTGPAAGGAGAGAGSKKSQGPDLEAIREQIETGNEIDRQLVESFNRFSMMIDRLHIANNHAVECLQQVRDSYSHTAMQMQEWIDKSRHRNTWLIGGAFLMSAAALVLVLILMYMLSTPK